MNGFMSEIQAVRRTARNGEPVEIIYFCTVCAGPCRMNEHPSVPNSPEPSGAQLPRVDLPVSMQRDPIAEATSLTAATPEGLGRDVAATSEEE